MFFNNGCSSIFLILLVLVILFLFCGNNGNGVTAFGNNCGPTCI